LLAAPSFPPPGCTGRAVPRTCGVAHAKVSFNNSPQLKLIAKVAAVLPRGGRFLFTSLSQIHSWADAITNKASISLGHDACQAALESNGFSLAGTCRDQGDSYYFTIKT
jgi:hypothetical protein